MTQPLTSSAPEGEGPAGAGGRDVAAITDLEQRLAAAERLAVAMGRERDYWRAQHDKVMADWGADLREFSAEKARTEVAGLDLQVRSLENLLAFFDPRTGAVAARRDRQLLSDAFAQALAARRFGAGAPQGD